MPAFGSRKKPAHEITQSASEPQPAPQSAAERLAAMLAEQAQIGATLDEHRAKRTELLKDGQLGAVRALASEDAELQLRSEQLALQLPDLERELQQEQREAWERAWESQRPGLAAAQAELVEAIQTFFTALEHCNMLHGRARNFGEKLREFATPPPPAPVYNDWSLRQYLDVVERRQRPAASSLPMLELEIEAPLHIPPAQRFVPRRVPHQLVEQVSPIAPMRRVKMLHAIRASNLAIGHARLRAGDEMMFPARAAFVLTFSGVGVYTDAETAETATAAA